MRINPRNEWAEETWSKLSLKLGTGLWKRHPDV